MTRRGRGALCAAFALACLALPTQAAPGETQRVHRVRDGETLSSIATLHFGNPHLWPALYRANRDQIRDPSRLYPGQTLSIPAVPSTLAPPRGAAVPRRSPSPPRHGGP